MISREVVEEAIGTPELRMVGLLRRWLKVAAYLGYTGKLAGDTRKELVDFENRVAMAGQHTTGSV